LEKRENESEFDHHKRLVYGKIKDKTLADYDYSELAPYVYDQDYSVDVARRMMYGSCRTLEKMDHELESSVTDDILLSKIESEKLELRRERQRFYDQRREFNKLVTQLGRQDHLYDRLADAASELSETVGIMFADDYAKDIPLSDNEAVLVFCDWHYGMITDNVFNTYDTEICKQRVKTVVGKAIERLMIHNCWKLHIVLLGDALHGGIHSGVRVASEELVCDQLMQVSEILAQSIFELSHYVREVDVHCTYGNHARTIQNKKDSIHRDNMERIIAWWLEQRVAAEEGRVGHSLGIRISNDTNSEFVFLNVAGVDICGAHGDLDSVKTSPKLLSTLFRKTYGKDIQCILLADKHHSESFEEFGIEAYIASSLCGTDEYANNKRLYSTPSQMMMIVNKESGIDAVYKLKVK